MQDHHLFGAPFDDMVSIGCTCRPFYQICRSKFKRRISPFVEADLRIALGGGDTTVFPEGGFLFDWMGTPLPAVTKGLTDGFDGFFDRDKLSINASGSVVNADGVIFYHSFSRMNKITSPQAIEEEYPLLKERMERLRLKTLNLFRSSSRILYVAVSPTVDEMRPFCDTMRSCYPSHRFMILSVVEKQDPKGLVYCDDQCATFEIGPWIKKTDSDWEGDGDEWGKALDPVVLSSTPATPAEYWGPSKLIAEAHDLLALNEFERAEAIFADLCERMPRHPMGLEGLARIAIARKRWDVALETWEQIRRVFPKRIQARYGIARALLKLQRYPEAEAAYRELSERFPGNASGAKGAATTAEAVGDWRKAREAWEFVQRQFPDEAAAAPGIARCQAKLSRLQASGKSLKAESASSKAAYGTGIEARPGVEAVAPAPPARTWPTRDIGSIGSLGRQRVG